MDLDSGYTLIFPVTPYPNFLHFHDPALMLSSSVCDCGHPIPFFRSRTSIWIAATRCLVYTDTTHGRRNKIPVGFIDYSTKPWDEDVPLNFAFDSFPSLRIIWPFTVHYTYVLYHSKLCATITSSLHYSPCLLIHSPRPIDTIKYSFLCRCFFNLVLCYCYYLVWRPFIIFFCIANI